MLGIIVLLVVFGILALLVAFSRWLARRPWSATGHASLALALFMLAHTAWPVDAHLRTYEPLPDASARIAQVHAEQTGQRSWRLTLTRLPDGRMQVYEMTGDQWRLEARTLAWRGRGAALGLPSGYRLEQLSGRTLYAGRADGDGPNEAPPPPGADAARLESGSSRYALADPDEPGEDVWSQARAGARWWSAHVDTDRVYGPWRPLVDGTRYDVWLDRTPDTADARLEVRQASTEAGAGTIR
jgi:hypothetical protein